MKFKLLLLINNLRKLDNSYDRLSRATPSAEIAEINADRALKNVVDLLSQKDVAEKLDTFLQEARNDLDSQQNNYENPDERQRQELIDKESQIVKIAGLGKKEVSELYGIFQQVKSEKGDFVSNTNDLITALNAFHKKYKADIKQSREQTKKVKKKRKRKLLQGAASAAFGTIIIVADIYVPPLATFSYAVGSGALFQSVRDFIGDPGDDS